MRKYLWKLTQTENTGWDTYDAAVVCSQSEEYARKIHPRGKDATHRDWSNGTWASSPGRVVAVKIGIADKSTPLNSVVVASFNAG